VPDGTPQNFAARLKLAQKASGGLLCVGLDPDLEKFPKDIPSAGPNAAVLAFNKRIIDATCDIAAAYKPQAAFYAAIAAEEALELSVRYIRERPSANYHVEFPRAQCLPEFHRVCGMARRHFQAQVLQFAQNIRRLRRVMLQQQQPQETNGRGGIFGFDSHRAHCKPRENNSRFTRVLR